MILKKIEREKMEEEEKKAKVPEEVSEEDVKVARAVLVKKMALARIDELEKANASMAADSLKWSSKLKAEMEACDRLARHRKQLMSALETERRVVRFTVDGELEIE